MCGQVSCHGCLSAVGAGAPTLRFTVQGPHLNPSVDLPGQLVGWVGLRMGMGWDLVMLYGDLSCNRFSFF
jgi:hypothetical protein